MATLLTVGKVICNKEERTIQNLSRIFVRLSGIQVVTNSFFFHFLSQIELFCEVSWYFNYWFMVFLSRNVWSLVLFITRNYLFSSWSFRNSGWN